jgi:exosortase
MLPHASTVSPVTVATADAVPGRVRWLAWLAVGELTLLYAPTVQWLFGRWTISVWEHAHGLLVPPIVAYFIHRELRQLGPIPSSASAWGFAILVPAVALRVLDVAMGTELLSAISLVLVLPGLSLVTIGAARTRAIVFPLAFLAFALPIPLAATEQVHWQLRQVAAHSSAFVLPWLGIPVFLEGTTLHMANASLQIADACSGFSTLYAAVATACLVAHSTPRTAQRLLVLLAAAPIAIAANVIRILLLVLIVIWQGSDILDTSIHPLTGVLTFVLSLPLIFRLGTPPAAGARA